MRPARMDPRLREDDECVWTPGWASAIWLEQLRISIAVIPAKAGIQ